MSVVFGAPPLAPNITLNTLKITDVVTVIFDLAYGTTNDQSSFFTLEYKDNDLTRYIKILVSHNTQTYKFTIAIPLVIGQPLIK